MDQSRAVSALAPFVALAKSATSSQAAANLIAQATAAPNTYVFADLLQQPRIHALATSESHKVHHQLLQCFSWGTWEEAKAIPDLPSLSDAQALKLRLLSLLTIASEKQTSQSTQTNLSYATLCARLDLATPIDLEHLVTEAIYQNLLTATLNPATQTVVVSSVAPLRDLAPGSVPGLISELEAWSARCDSTLAELEAEIRKVHTDAEKRAKRALITDKQIEAAHDTGEREGRNSGKGAAASGRGAAGRDLRDADLDEDDDGMDVDDSASQAMGSGRKKPTPNVASAIFGKFARERERGR